MIYNNWDLVKKFELVWLAEGSGGKRNWDPCRPLRLIEEILELTSRSKTNYAVINMSNGKMYTLTIAEQVANYRAWKNSLQEAINRITLILKELELPMLPMYLAYIEKMYDKKADYLYAAGFEKEWKEKYANTSIPVPE